MSETIDEARREERSSHPSHEEEHERRDEGQRHVKVTDKRMFRPDGELREEYSFLDEGGKPSQEGGPMSHEPRAEKEPPVAAPSSTPSSAPSPEPSATASASELLGASAPGQGSTTAPRDVPKDAPQDVPTDVPGYDAGPQRASFLNLLSVLAEPVAIYLGDVQLPDGRSAENLEMARLHIDLLRVLKEKTRGNCTTEETAILDDLLYRLQMRYVQKSGG